MAWTINGNSLESYGVTVASIDFNHLSADVLTLESSADYDSPLPADLEFGDSVTLQKDGATWFRGTVTRTPRSASPNSERIGYEVSGAFWDLDNLTLQEEKTYVSSFDDPMTPGEESIPVTVNRHIPYVVFGRDGETTGERIEAVIDYAIAQGVALQKGTFYAGIPWFPTEHKDQTCGQVIRDYLRITPDAIFSIDHTTSPPTCSFKQQSDLTTRTIQIGVDDVTDHDIVKHEAEVPNGVVINYERPVTQDGQTYVELIQDIAGASSGLRVITATIPLAGTTITTQKATCVTIDIPTDGATDEDTKLWWIKHIPELQKIGQILTLESLATIIQIPSSDVPILDVRRHKRSFPELPTAPTPINPESTPIGQTDDLDDYPRELIGGSIPPWTRLRARAMTVTATLAVLASTVDAIVDDASKKALQEIFKTAKTISGTEYLTTNYTVTVTATNARNKEYSTVSSFQLGETPPTGIAAAVLAQYSRTRHSGSITLRGAEPFLNPKLGDKLNVTGASSEWATMGELVQSVSHDIKSGTSSISFGPHDMLGPNDLIERLQAAKIVPYTYGFEPNDTKQDRNTIDLPSATPRDIVSKTDGGGAATTDTKHAFYCEYSIVMDGETEVPTWRVWPGALYARRARYYANYALDAETSDNLTLFADGENSRGLSSRYGVYFGGDEVFDPIVLTGEGTPHLKWQTDYVGQIPTPELVEVVLATSPTTVKFYEGGELSTGGISPRNGEYYVQLARLDTVEGEPVMRQLLRSDYFWSPISSYGGFPVAPIDPPTYP